MSSKLMVMWGRIRHGRLLARVMTLYCFLIPAIRGSRGRRKADMLVSLEFALMMSGGGGAGVVRCGRVQRLILSVLLHRKSRQSLSLYPAFHFRDE